MSGADWIFVGALAAAAIGLRLAGLLAGARLARSRLAPVLDEMPGLILVSLVASALAGAPPHAWAAAGVALGAAILSRDVLVTMVAGVAAYAGIGALMG